MKKIFNIIIFILFYFLLMPSGVFAITKETGYIDINEKIEFELDELEFKEIEYINEKDNIGLKGKIINSYDNDLGFTYIITFYDANCNMLFQQDKSYVTPSGKSDLNLLFSKQTLKNISNEDIGFYDLTIVFDEENKEDTHSILTYTKNDIEIVVNEDNTFDITETITINYESPAHGFYKYIAYEKGVSNVSNIEVNDTFEVTNTDTEYKIKIGSLDNVVHNEKTYIIKYKYSIINDTYGDFYFNIIGNGIKNTLMKNITFSIVMPKKIDSNKVSFMDINDNNNIEGLTYSIKDNTIKGEYSKIIKTGEMITIRYDLPNNYFKNEKFNYFVLLISLFPLLFLIETILSFKKIEKNCKSKSSTITFVIILILAGYLLTTLSFIIKNITLSNIVLLVIFPLIEFIFLILMMIRNIDCKKLIVAISTELLYYLITFIFVIIPLLKNNIYVLVYSLSIFCILLMIYYLYKIFNYNR